MTADNKTQTFLSSVKIGPKGQIVIPKEVREMFGIQTGDNLILMADSHRGIAIQTGDYMRDFAQKMFRGDFPAGTFADAQAENAFRERLAREGNEAAAEMQNFAAKILEKTENT